MLSHDVMGLVALAVLWLNTLLVVLAALGPLADLLRRLMRIRRLGMVVGDVEGDEPLAEYVVEQVGRRAADDADRQAILFHDRQRTSIVHGGTVRRGADVIAIAEAPAGRAEVWIAPRDTARELRERQAETPFDEAYTSSGKPKGFERRLSFAIHRARVWVVGARRGAGIEDGIEAPADAPLLVATHDPRVWLALRALWLGGFVTLVLGAALAITWLALYPPIFGTVSTVGGALGLVFFLLVQPAGTAARDAVLLPDRAPLRGSWVKPGSQGAGGPGDELVPDHLRGT
jgi:hypothetical protein